MITWGWNGPPSVDVATAAGKQEFVDQYIRFYNQYYSVNQDPHADSYVAQIDNRVVLDTWIVKYNLISPGSLTRHDVESRLASVFGHDHPIFNSGVYMVVSDYFMNPDFIDEKVAQFQCLQYCYVNHTNGITAVQLKPGFWNQNISNPGAILPRDGGTHYMEAWNWVVDQDDAWTVDRVYIESWNEYDEGSGIYAVDTDASPYISPGSGNTSTDTWSNTNDPFEYIKTTAEGARQFNDTPDRDSSILWHNMPTEMNPGETRTVQVVVRNEGDLSWTAAEDFKFGQKEYLEGEVLFGSSRYLIDDTQDEIPFYGGIFRGRPIMFEFALIAPSTEGDYLTHWGMLQENVWFGEELALPITVVPEPGTIVMLLGLAATLAGYGWWTRRRS